MHNHIQAILCRTPGLKAKAIAAQLRADRGLVNKVLHDNKDVFVQDLKEFTWSLVSQTELRIELGDHRWLSADIFESALLGARSPLDSAKAYGNYYGTW